MFYPTIPISSQTIKTCDQYNMLVQTINTIDLAYKYNDIRSYFSFNRQNNAIIDVMLCNKIPLVKRKGHQKPNEIQIIEYKLLRINLLKQIMIFKQLEEPKICINQLLLWVTQSPINDQQ